jgi:pyrroline-5-carboxylate reductase
MKIGIIGVGNMGFAIAKGMKKRFPEIVIAIMDADSEKAGNVSEAVSGKTFRQGDYRAFCDYSEIIILAVKPQHLDELLGDLSKFTETKKIISIAAGKTLSYFHEKTGSDNVVRFMPNIAATVGESIVAVSPGKHASRDFISEAIEVAESVGKSIILSESEMSAFTGLSGCGIAYAFSFIHALALGGTEQGIAYDKSLAIAIQTLEGATALLKKSKENPISLLTKVTSAGGATIVGIKALEEGKFTATVMDAVKKSRDRADELEG